MKAFFKKLRMFFVVGVLSISLTVSNTAAVTYQASAIPVVYTCWQTLVTIFALLGITICAAPDISEEESAQELLDAFAGWKVLNGEGQGDNDGDGKDDVYSFDPLSYLFGNKLTIPEEDLELWQQFYYEHMAPPIEYNPIYDVNLYGCSEDEYSDFLCSYLNITSLNSYYKDFISKSYSSFDNDYSCVIYGDSLNYYYFSLSGSSNFSFYETDLDTNVFVFSRGSMKLNSLCRMQMSKGVPLHYTTNIGSYFYYGDTVHLCIINGRLYNLYDICGNVFNFSSSSNDRSSIFALSDFVVSVNNIGSSFTDIVNSIGGLNLSSTLSAGDFDVIGGDRIYDEDLQEAVGDITVTMPSPETITDYSNGALTYEQLMEALDTIPINESAGTNLLTQEFLTTQTGIFSGVTSIVEILQNIWAWLNNLIDSIVQAFIDMLVGLFVPGDGFIDGKIGQIQSKLDSIGVAPYDMSYIFESDDGNPFKNITIDIYGKEVVIVSFDYLPPFLDKFRPVVRGLLVLFLLYYSINQLLALLRLSGMMEGGNINQLSIQGSTVPRIEDKGGRL